MPGKVMFVVLGVRCALAPLTRESGTRCSSAALQGVAERGDALGVFCQRCFRDLRSLSQADDSGNVLGAGPEASLVMTTVKELAQARAAADVESADAFWSVELVPGKREQVEFESVHIDRNFARGLHGVGVEVDVGFGRDLADFFEGLHGAELIVGVHDGDQHGLGMLAQGVAEGLEIDLSVAIDREIGDRDSALLKRLAGIEHGFVLDCGGDDVRERSVDCLKVSCCRRRVAADTATS